MRSRKGDLLSRKEWRELLTSRVSLIVALLVPLLVGQAFILAVDLYAELSGGGAINGPSALAEGMRPLDGLVAPLFGAYAVVGFLLFPFVAIRMVSVEKDHGALRLMLQLGRRYGLARQLATKFGVLVAAWIALWVPGLAALALWRAYGGHLHAAEVDAVLLGHLLRGMLVSAVALCAAAIMEGAAAAAVVTLAFTLGTWVLDFLAQIRGGWMQRVADVGPEAALRAFERGEIRLAAVAMFVAAIAALMASAYVWLHPGRPLARKVAFSSVIVVAFVSVAPLAATLRASWDVSEDRRNSFSREDEAVLGTITAPLRVEVNLAPNDPRYTDLDRGVLRKLEHTLPDVTIVNVAQGSTGLFAGPGYGRVVYTLGARSDTSRSTTVPIVLDLIYGLAGVQPPQRTASTYPGYPLVAKPRFAAILFYFAFPLLVLLAWRWYRRRTVLGISTAGVAE